MLTIVHRARAAITVVGGSGLLVLAACTQPQRSPTAREDGITQNTGGTDDTSADAMDASADPGDSDTGSGSGVDSAMDTGDPRDSGADTGETGPGADTGDIEETAAVETIKTVFVLVMENHNWHDILGNADAPYINDTLLPMASSTDNYYGNPLAIHPSLPNYIWMESGDNHDIWSDDDPSADNVISADHLSAQLEAAGLSWRSYQEDMPEGICPIYSYGLYAPKHNPFVYFEDVSGSPPSTSATHCIDHMAPYTQLEADLAAGTVASYNFITPNQCNDMHNASGCATDSQVKNGDDWLAIAVPQILASDAWADGGVLFITWDESEGGEYPIGMIVLSPLAKGGGYVGTTRYYHSSLLRTVEEIFGLPLLGDAAAQDNLSDLFTTFP
ncbi:hypothetical protein LBMAG42_40180 [Deltaproteobacteria bacterium]|nr:hypothetical protein LBMAG42_40180 [Deltaproteobacteria bacterium]